MLFRFQRLLRSQAVACRDISTALAMGKSYTHDEKSLKALNELQDSLQYLHDQNKPGGKMLLIQLDFLFNNLATVERQLMNINNPDATHTEEENDIQLSDNEAHGVKELAKAYQCAI